VRADRAHVDPDLLCGEAGEDPVGAGGDTFEDVVIGEGREEDVGGLRDLARGVAPAQPFVHEVLCMLAVARFAVDGVAGGEEPDGHVSAHVPEADETERGHDERLRRAGFVEPLTDFNRRPLLTMRSWSRSVARNRSQPER
jgi:hypothetical protein